MIRGSDADNLFKIIDARREELVELTRSLIRFPDRQSAGRGLSTLRGIHRPALERPRIRRRLCAGGRARRATASAIRASMSLRGAKAMRAGPCVHFNSHIDVVQTGAGWTAGPLRRRRPGRQDLWPRRLRHEGWTRRVHHRGRSADRLRAQIAGRAGDFGHGRRGVRRLRRRSLSGAARLVFRRRASITSSSRSRSTSIASASVTAAYGGPRSKPTGAWRTDPCRSWATAPCAT